MTKHSALQRIYLAGLALLLVVLAIVLASRSPVPIAPVIFLSKPYRMSAPSIFALQRWLPITPSWSWLWRLKDSVFGRPKPVDLEVSIFELADSPQSVRSRFSLAHPADAQTNGLQAWLVPDAELGQLRHQLREDKSNHFVNAARISTATGICAALFTGQTILLNGLTNNVGLGVEMLPRVRRDVIDLTASILFSQPVTNSLQQDETASSTAGISIRTNLDVGARFQIRDPGGLFLVNSSPDGAKAKCTAVLVSARLPGRKK